MIVKTDVSFAFAALVVMTTVTPTTQPASIQRNSYLSVQLFRKTNSKPDPLYSLNISEKDDERVIHYYINVLENTYLQFARDLQSWSWIKYPIEHHTD